MSSQGSHEEAHGRYLAALSLTALGIVFGDIGTSPIYASAHGLFQDSPEPRGGTRDAGAVVVIRGVESFSRFGPGRLTTRRSRPPLVRLATYLPDSRDEEA